MATLPDMRPVLVCRLECPPRMLADVDGWMPSHFDDSLVHPLVTAAASYAVLRDFRAPDHGGLPAVMNGHGNRFIVYVYDRIEGVAEFIDSPLVRAAIADGESREGQYPPIDDEPFNGVVYTVCEVRGACASDLAGVGPIVAERFEVSERDAAAFDAWLDGPHLAGAAALPGVRRARTFEAFRDLPHRFPHDRYLGKGNRMLWIELEEGIDMRTWPASSAARSWLADSVAWDVHLSYVRREVAEHLLTRTRAQALEARRG